MTGSDPHHIPNPLIQVMTNYVRSGTKCMWKLSTSQSWSCICT